MTIRLLAPSGSIALKKNEAQEEPRKVYFLYFLILIEGTNQGI